MKETLGEKLGYRTLNLFLLLLSLCTLYPFWHVLMYAFSDPKLSMGGGIFLLPRGFSLSSFEILLNSRGIYEAYWNSLVRLFAGTFINLLFTAMLAYPLSLKRFIGRDTITLLIFFTMLFSGGMIPTYLVVKSLGLLNSFWGMIFPGLTGAFHIIVMKSFFQSIPAELEDSARVDGCSPFGVFFRIILPLSLPMLAAIFLFKAVGHWNAFFDAILYITDRSMYPLQVYLRDLIMLDQMTKDFMIEDVEKTVPTESLKAATLMTSMLPILLVYPFLQKYFVKGMMLGSVKG
jgi:putative aldouronate transport system permease protein